MKNASDHKKAAERAKDVGNPIIATTGKSKPLVDSRLIAQHLGLQHGSIVRLLTQYADDFRQFGILRFQIREIQGRGQPERYAMLSEDQAYLLLTYCRNTAKVRSLKLRLVKAFREARQTLDLRRSEYLPTYHELHGYVERLAGQSPNKRFVHINVNKAINWAVGIQAGQRRGLSLPRQATLILAQTVACNVMSQAADHKDGFRAVVRALLSLKQAIAVGGKGAK